MSIKDACCLNCEERKLGCHQKCVKYLHYRKQLDDLKQKRTAEKEMYSYTNGRRYK